MRASPLTSAVTQAANLIKFTLLVMSVLHNLARIPIFSLLQTNAGVDTFQLRVPSGLLKPLLRCLKMSDVLSKKKAPPNSRSTQTHHHLFTGSHARMHASERAQRKQAEAHFSLRQLALTLSTIPTPQTLTSSFIRSGTSTNSTNS